MARAKSSALEWWNSPDLSDGERETVRLYFWELMDPGKVASSLHLTLPQLSSVLKSIRVKLRHKRGEDFTKNQATTP